MKNGERWKRNLLTWLWIQWRQQQQWFWSRWLSSAYVRPLFIGLFVPCSCFQSLSFCFLALVLCLLRLFFLYVSLVLFLFTLSSLLFLFSSVSVPSVSVCFFLFFSCSHMLCLSLFFFSVLGSVLGWFFLCRDEDDGGVDLWFLSAFLPFSLGIFFLCLCSVLLCLFPHWFPVLAFSNPLFVRLLCFFLKKPEATSRPPPFFSLLFILYKPSNTLTLSY